MNIIAIANQKGGCGKTTTAVNLAASLALSGHRTLLLDFDPQGHSTLGLGKELSTLNKTIYEVMVEDRVGISRQVQQQLREHFGALVFDTVIHKNTRLAEAPSAGQPILTYAPNNRAAFEYRALAEEMKGRIKALEDHA